MCSLSNRRFTEVILHIGLGKTGTTAIQQTLLAGADRLEQHHDIHFPVKFDDPRPFGGNHTLFLRSLFQPGAETRRPNIVAGLGSAEALAQANANLRTQFQAGFDNSNASRLLLSAEGVGHFTEASLANLMGWLCELSDSIRVIACLRHPRHALASEIQQRLKTGSLLKNMQLFPPYYAFEKLFSQLEKYVPRDAITVYDYAESRRSQQGITGLLLSKLGIDAGGEFQTSPVVNKGISHEATLLLDSINRQRPLVVDGEMNPKRSMGDTQAFLKIPGRKYVPDLEVYELLDECVAPDLEWLSQHYGIHLDAMGAGEGAISGAIPGDFSVEALDELALRVSDLANGKLRDQQRMEQTRPPAAITGLKPLTLHIGMGKTGTTVLQKFFWNNRELLEQRGIVYPSSGAVDHAHHLLSPHIPHYMRERWEFRNVQQWTTQLAELDQPQVLLSSEIMISATPAEIRRYFEVVCQHYRPRVVVYLRRQDHMIASLYNQLVKSGRQKRPLEAILPTQIRKQDYIHRLKPWEHVLGSEALLVRPYEHEQLYAGDVRSDFMHHVFDMEIDDGFEMAEEDPNPGYPLEILDFKRCLNWVVQERPLHRRCNELLQAYAAREPEVTVAVSGAPGTLDVPGRRQVLDAVAESNARIAREYLGREDGRLFLEAQPDSTNVSESVELCPERAADIAAHIRECDPEVAESLVKLIRDSRDATGPYHRQAVQLLDSAFS